MTGIDGIIESRQGEFKIHTGLKGGTGETAPAYCDPCGWQTNFVSACYNKDGSYNSVWNCYSPDE